MSTSDIYSADGAYAPYVTFTLKPGSRIVAEPGAFMFKDANISMNTTMLDKKNREGRGFAGGLIAKAWGGKILQLAFHNASQYPGRVGLEPPNGGTVLALKMDVFPEVIAVKDSFMAATTGLRFDMVRTENNVVKMWLGDQDSFMQRLSLPQEQAGQGHLLFLSSAVGRVAQMNLREGETVEVYPTALLGLTPDVSMTLEKVKGFSARHLGVKTRYLTRLQGPGTAWLHTSTVAYAGVAGDTLATGLRLTV